LAVYGSDKGTLCIDCFAELAEKKGIHLTAEDIGRIEFFESDESWREKKDEPE